MDSYIPENNPSNFESRLDVFNFTTDGDSETNRSLQELDVCNLSTDYDLLNCEHTEDHLSNTKRGIESNRVEGNLETQNLEENIGSALDVFDFAIDENTEMNTSLGEFRNQHLEKRRNATPKKRTRDAREHTYPKSRYSLECKFCLNPVTNFERHLKRNHQDEKEVKELMMYPTNTVEGKQKRRNLLSLLRNQTNFNQYIYDDDSESNKIPCAFCKRVVKKSYLKRHYKKCLLKPVKKSKRLNHLAASQTMIALASQHTNTAATIRVKNEVFSRMMADEIGNVARKDPLIRYFGEEYLKKHKRAQLAIACSNKMRECARLLIEIRRRLLRPDLSLIDILNPVLFDDIVLATKDISGYNVDTKTYKAPSLADHMGTTLKRISDCALELLFMENSSIKVDDTENKRKEIKRFNFLVRSKWNFEVSSLAIKDLSEKRWIKPIILPLTEDILLLKDYILKESQHGFNLLLDNNADVAAYRKLVDGTLAFTILYNRRRVGDVQYLTIECYQRNSTATSQTEFADTLSESERVLTRTYKRVTTGGKHSRAVVILFPPLLQKFVNLLIDVRNRTNIVPVENRYLFAYPGQHNQWVRGDIVLRNLAKNSNAKNPSALTSNRLRKQIATVMQLANLEKTDYLEFAKFMGHTEKTHQEFYEVTQDLYQTAKIAKLLNMFDKGKGLEYRNKDLTTINIDPSTELVSEDSEDEIRVGSIETASSSRNRVISSSTSSDSEREETESRKRKNKKRKLPARVKWTTEQKSVVMKHFSKHIEMKKVPKKDECLELMHTNEDLLSNLDWVKVKTLVYNAYRNEKQ